MTDESKHSPGEWHLGKAGYDIAIYDDKGASIAVVPDMLPDDEKLANARLIVAAPDLLEALELYRTEGDYEGKPSKEDIRKKADAAITKAEIG